MRLTCLVAVALCVTGLLSIAHAASTTIGGETWSCPAATEIASDNEISVFGLTDTVDRVIFLNHRKLATHERYFRRFVFLHECGHIHVGSNEAAADCWAAKRGKQEGWLTPDHLPSICRRLGGGSDRCQALQTCYAAADPAHHPDISASLSEPLADKDKAKAQSVRPREPSAQLNLRVDETVKDRLTELADARGVSLPEMLERILNEWQQAKNVKR
jgi:Ribbon-helix-helix protein, copG family